MVSNKMDIQSEKKNVRTNNGQQTTKRDKKKRFSPNSQTQKRARTQTQNPDYSYITSADISVFVYYKMELSALKC